MKSLADYNIDKNTGFIINQRQMVKLSDYYDPWIELNTNLEDLINSRSLCKYVEEMPLLSVKYLTNDDERRFCRCIFAMITTAFVWHQREIFIPKILPKSIAVPFKNLSDYFGLMPILCHTDMVLFNSIVDTSKKFTEKTCLSIKNQIRKNYNWTVFQRETGRIELLFAPIVSAIENIHISIPNNDLDLITSNLEIICDTVFVMKNSMQTFKEMNPDYFHMEMRPFLVGWSGDAFPYKNGMFYENEDGSYSQMECIGASAAQSPTFQTLDTLFNIEHSIDNQKFFDTMKMYMVKGHRDFIEDVGKFIKLREIVYSNQHHKPLVEGYNKCLNAISRFRTGHMQTVTKYIINPAKKVSSSSTQIEFLQEKGTGGQDLINFLKEVRNDTKANILE